MQTSDSGCSERESSSRFVITKPEASPSRTPGIGGDHGAGAGRQHEPRRGQCLAACGDLKALPRFAEDPALGGENRHAMRLHCRAHTPDERSDHAVLPRDDLRVVDGDVLRRHAVFRAVQRRLDTAWRSKEGSLSGCSPRSDRCRPARAFRSVLSAAPPFPRAPRRDIRPGRRRSRSDQIPAFQIPPAVFFLSLAYPAVDWKCLFVMYIFRLCCFALLLL